MSLNHFSSSQRAGQRLMVGFNGTRLNDELKIYIDQVKVGGIILFARNLESANQIEDLCAKAQEYAAQCSQPPLLISIDQEGGAVARLKPPFTQFPGNPHMKTLTDANDFARITAKELNSIGVNMNMAPVLDVLPLQGPSIMQDRAFGNDPQWVAQMGSTIITRFQQDHIIAVAKHFPGIGRTILDSHLDLPDLEIGIHDLTETDLVPFITAIEHQVAGIMLSHIRYTNLDAQWPASLSPPIAKALLRDQMEFNGVVLTDDLDMGAIAKYYTIETIAQQCLIAETDILLICHASPKIQALATEIQHCCENSLKLAEKERQSLERILALKAAYLKNS